MHPDRWQQLSRIYHALAHCDAADRTAFLDEVCRGDTALHRELESLLAHERSGDTLIGRHAPRPLPVAGRDRGGRLPGARGAGRRWHGRRVPCARHAAAPRRRAQDPARGCSRIDADRLARFRREAQVLASLNHPNIAQIYGLEDADGRYGLVLELVEGPTLADRIAGGPLRSTRRWGSRDSSPTRSRPRTTAASCIAISSPPTSRCARTAPSRCWTSAWPRRSPPRRSRSRRRASAHRRAAGWSSAPCPTWRRSRRAARTPTSARTSGRSARALRDGHGPKPVRGRERGRHGGRNPLSRARLGPRAGARAAPAQALPREGRRTPASADRGRARRPRASAGVLPRPAAPARGGLAGAAAAVAPCVLAVVCSLTDFTRRRPRRLPSPVSDSRAAAVHVRRLLRGVARWPACRVSSGRCGGAAQPSGCIRSRPTSRVRCRASAISAPARSSGRAIAGSSRFVGSGGKLMKIDIQGGAPQPIVEIPRGWGGAAWNNDDVIVLGQAEGGLLRVSARGGRAVAADRARTTPVRRWATVGRDSCPTDGTSSTAARPGWRRTRSCMSAPSMPTRASSHRSRCSSPIRGLPTRRPPDPTRGHLLVVRDGCAARVSVRRAPFHAGGRAGADRGRCGGRAQRARVAIASVSASGNGVLAYRRVETVAAMPVWVGRDGRELGALADETLDMPHLSPDLARWHTGRDAGGRRPVGVSRRRPAADQADVRQQRRRQRHAGVESRRPQPGL